MSLWQMSLCGAAMIAVVALIRALALHRLPKWFLMALWGLVLARLLIPASAPSPIGIYGLGWNSGVESSAVPQSNDMPGTVESVHPAYRPSLTEGGDPDIASGREPDILAIIWLAGAASCGAVFAWINIRCRREFREALPVDGEHGEYLDRWRRSLLLARQVNVRQSDRIDAPLTYGILRPVILLPKAFDWEDSPSLEYVLAHELAHIRRMDGLWKLLMVLALCVHWFNPLVWVMYVLMNRDMELACDEAVLREMGSPSGYAMTLIRMEEHRAGVSLGSHFSRNAIEERIVAIMKMNRKSVLAVLLALGLVGGTAGVFAASARADGSTAGEAYDSAYDLADKDSLMSYTDPDGVTYYSWDDGETWTAMTDEEFAEAYPDPEVEWWTAEEYADWLEQEKKDLQSIIGTQSWTPSTGWFTWTQKRVNMTIAEYEETLAAIRNGVKVSKPIYEKDGAVTFASEPIENVEVLETGPALGGNIDYDKLFAEYREHGLSFSDDGNLYWNGQRVRIFVDGADHEGGYVSQYEHYDPDGTVDVRAVREKVYNGDGSYSLFGPLVRLEEFEPEQMFLDALAGQKYVLDEIQYDAGQTSRELERYKEFGLEYEYGPSLSAGSLSMSWNGQPVRSLFDPERQFWFCNSLGTKGLDIEAVYEGGKLTGLRGSKGEKTLVESGSVFSYTEIFDKNTGERYTFAEGDGAYTDGKTGAQGSVNTGKTIAERMKSYEPYGVRYNERNGVRDIEYNGREAAVFADVRPDGSAFTLQSTAGEGIVLQTVYKDGKLAGVEVLG